MDLGISGKWALVCGASKGLGLGCARALVQEGVSVLMVARGAEALQAAAEQLQLQALDASQPGTTVQWVAADITTEAGRAAVLARRADFDILVTNAGGPPAGDFRNFERDDWIRALDANMLTPIALIRATVDGMAARGFGRIVNITSSAVKAPIDVLGLSNGARSGLTGFVAGLARSGVAARGVTINNLLPGAFDTERLQSIFQGAAVKTAQPLEVVAAARRNAIPARRFGSIDEFGAICAFLCSQQAGYMTGQNVLADGGAYAGTF
jgi:3-oxoacyl-[acyl-carrier protein] reductase